MVHSPLSSCSSSLSVYTIRQVEVSSPSAESENTLCTSAILASTMCSKIMTAATTSVTSSITSSGVLKLKDSECSANDSGLNSNSHQNGIAPSMNGKFKGHSFSSYLTLITASIGYMKLVWHHRLRFFTTHLLQYLIPSAS